MELPPASASVAIAHSFRGFQSALTLPVPGAPSSTLSLYRARLRARLRAAFAGANPRVCTAFWLFGLINNVLYVIILSAALDLVGPSLPKAIVLLADVLPSLLTKLIAPYFIHHVPYHIRILILVALSFAGMQLVAWQSALSARLFGVVLASVASGLGELSFLGMTHYYGSFAVPFWGSGTGAAGVVGAGLYVCATTWLGISVRGSIMVFGFLPGIMLVAFFGVLPRGVLKEGPGRRGYEPIQEQGEGEEGGGGRSFEERAVKGDDTLQGFHAKFRRVAKLFFPYMLPLLLVYIAEYTINLGVAPTLLFPLESMPFSHYRDAYPMYNTVYQIGVFISRSSTPFIRVHSLYIPSFLQILNLVVLTAHAMYGFLPNIWVVFLIVFWEGILGGLVYVNTFAEITEREEGAEREFCLGATTVADSGGICVAGVMALALEPWLCQWQVVRGREYCRLT